MVDQIADFKLKLGIVFILAAMIVSEASSPTFLRILSTPLSKGKSYKPLQAAPLHAGQ